jgi:hypothetical protein
MYNYKITMEIQRSSFVLVLVVVVVTTAGCSSLSGGTTTPNNNETSSGYGVSGENLNGSAIQQSMEQRVEDAGSYTLTATSTLTSTRGNQTVTGDNEFTLRVDLGSEQGLLNAQTAPLRETGPINKTRAVFTDGNTSYQRLVRNGTVSYDRQTGPANGPDDFTPIGVDEFDHQYEPLVDAFEWEANGTTQIDGVIVTTYTATGVQNKTDLNIQQSTAVSDPRASMAIDSNGIVRTYSASYSFGEGSDMTSIEVTQRIANIGTTTVSEPDWLSNARS